MYRQVLVHSDDRHLQRILWRSAPNLSIRIYEPNTVTYGRAAATFLATRCLKQLTEDETTNYPEARRVAAYDFYVDDTITGAEDLHQAS
jgi:hypothetical protein